MRAAWQSIMRGKAKAVSKMFLVEIGKNIFLLAFISEFRSLKFPERENWELEVPGTWELRNLLSRNLYIILTVSLLMYLSIIYRKVIH